MASNAQIKYARALYGILYEEAKLNEYHELVFVGSLTKAFKRTGASSAYYSAIRKLLVESGSIEITQRGTAKQPSEVRVNDLNENILSDPLTARSGAATIRSEVDRRLAALESWRETTGGLNIAEALRNIELRLSKLEGTQLEVSETGG